MEKSMANQSVKQRANSMSNHRDGEAVRFILTNVQADLAALRASFVLLTAKLDADAGVTDVNYGILTNPAALSTLP
jgi:hypothetical protein